MKRKWIQTTIWVTAVALAGAAWLAFAPSALGGSVDYIVVSGSSMRPEIKGGDLIVVRQRHDYQVGDVTAYNSRKLGRTVLHRITGVGPDGYTFKGDNNSWTDPETVAADDLIGTRWLHMPGAGRALGALGQPTIIAVLGGLLVLTAWFGRRGRDRRPRQVLAPSPVGLPQSGGIPGVAIPFVAAGTAFLLLGAIAFARPPTRTQHTPTAYEQQGSFSYGAKVGQSTVYSDGTIDTGDTVFFQIADKLDVDFSYDLASSEAVNTVGSIRLAGELRDPNGWTSEFVLDRNREFAGSSVTASGTLDLAAIRRTIGRLERDTGVHSSSYGVAIMPVVTVEGDIGGADVAESFAPTLLFQMDALQMKTAPPASGSSTQADPFNPVADGVVQIASTRTNQVGLLGLGVSVIVARWTAVVGLILAMAGAAALTYRLRDLPPLEESERIRRRYRSLIVDGRLEYTGLQKPTVRVDSIRPLARMASRLQKVILHEQRVGTDVYSLEDDGIVYRFVLSAEGGDSSFDGITLLDEEPDVTIIHRKAESQRT